MYIWVGEKLLFPMLDVVLICIYFYSLTMGDVRSQYSAKNRFVFGKTEYMFLVEAIANIVLNYFFWVKVWSTWYNNSHVASLFFYKLWVGLFYNF